MVDMDMSGQRGRADVGRRPNDVSDICKKFVRTQFLIRPSRSYPVRGTFDASSGRVKLRITSCVTVSTQSKPVRSQFNLVPGMSNPVLTR